MPEFHQGCHSGVDLIATQPKCPGRQRPHPGVRIKWIGPASPGQVVVNIPPKATRQGRPVEALGRAAERGNCHKLID